MEESKKTINETETDIIKNFSDEKVLELNIDNYEGLLELLLDLAKHKKLI